jgi:hypothetical protein
MSIAKIFKDHLPMQKARTSGVVSRLRRVLTRMTEATTSAFLSYRWAKMKFTMAEGMEAERRMIERVVPWMWKKDTMPRASRNPRPIRRKAPAKARGKE